MFKANLIPWMLVFAIIALWMIVFKSQLSFVLSGNTEAGVIVESAIPFVTFFAFLGCTNRLVMSLLHAVKSQTVIFSLSVVDYYLVGIPFMLLLTCNLDMGVNGIFLGAAIGTGVATLLATRRLFMVDMELESKITQKRLAEEKRAMQKEFTSYYFTEDEGHCESAPLLQ